MGALFFLFFSLLTKSFFDSIFLFQTSALTILNQSLLSQTLYNEKFAEVALSTNASPIEKDEFLPLNENSKLPNWDKIFKNQKSCYQETLFSLQKDHSFLSPLSCSVPETVSQSTTYFGNITSTLAISSVNNDQPLQIASSGGIFLNQLVVSGYSTIISVGDIAIAELSCDEKSHVLLFSLGTIKVENKNDCKNLEFFPFLLKNQSILKKYFPTRDSFLYGIRINLE